MERCSIETPADAGRFALLAIKHGKPVRLSKQASIGKILKHGTIANRYVQFQNAVLVISGAAIVSAYYYDSSDHNRKWFDVDDKTRTRKH